MISARQIISTTDKAFSELWAIYTEAIPQNEAKCFDDFSKLVSRNDYCVLVFELDNKVVAFTMMYIPSRSNFALLEYMAVTKTERSGGIGSAAFQSAVSDKHLSKRIDVVIIEVDSPREKNAKDASLRSRRMDFYARNGCRQIKNLHYLFPLVCPTPAPEMDLLVYPRGNLQPIAKETLSQWLTTIFFDVYGCDQNDPRIALMMSSQPDPVVTTPPVPIRELSQKIEHELSQLFPRNTDRQAR